MTELTRLQAGIVMRDLGKRTRLMVAAITSIALALRLFGLGRQGLWFDEAYSIFVARLPISFSFDVLISDGVHPPFYYLIQRIAMPLGEGEASVRLPAMLIGLLSVPLMFMLGNLLAGERSGLIAATLTAISPFHIWYSQEARMYSALMLLSIACMLAYVQLLRPDPSRRLQVVFVLASGLAYGTHYFALFLPLIQLAHIAFHFRRQHRLLANWLLLQVIAVLPLALWIFRIYQQPQAIFGIGWIDIPRLIDLWHTVVNFSLGFVNNADAVRWIGAAVFLALAILGARSLWRFEMATSLVVIWALLPLVLTFFFSLRKPVYVDRFLIVSLPAYVLLVARGLDSLKRSALVAAGIAMLLFSIYGIATFTFGPDQQKEDWRAAAEYLTRAQEDETLVVRTLQMVIPLAYYHPEYESFEVIEVNRAVTPISDLSNGYAGTWLLYWSPASDAHSVAAHAALSIEDEADPQVARWMVGLGPEILERIDFRGLTIFHFNEYSSEL